MSFLGLQRLVTLALLVASATGVAKADLVINVDTAGCQTNMAINNGVGQSFQLPSTVVLNSIDIWIKPELYYTTSYNVELWDGEGGTTKLATSSTLTLASQTSGVASTWYSFAFSSQKLVLLPARPYTLKLQRLSQYSGGFSDCPNVYPGGILYWLTTSAEHYADMSFRVQAAPLAASWPFNGTLNDLSPANRGPAVLVGSNVALASDGGCLQIRQPGYVNLPRVDIHASSFFTVAFSLRVPAGSSSGRRFLYADWSWGQWQFLSTIDVAGTLSLGLRRNIYTEGSDPEQGLVGVTSSVTIPIGTWFDVAWSFDRSARTLTLFLNNQVVGTATVRASVTDVTIKDSQSSYYQFGRKADESPDGLLDADLRDMRLFVSTA